MRGLTRTRKRVIPRCCTGEMSNPHVPTGDTSLTSLNAVRGQGVQVIPCGCRLTRCRPTHPMAQRAGSTSLLKWRFPPKCHGDRGDWSSRSCRSGLPGLRRAAGPTSPTMRRNLLWFDGMRCFSLLMHRPPHVDSGPYIGRKQRGVRVRPRLWHK